jgi:hypothetical protein
MKYGLLSLLGGVVLVSVLMAQAPTPPDPPRPEGGKAPAEAQKAPPGDRFVPGGPGFGARGRAGGPAIVPTGPASARSTVQSADRGSAGLTPGLAGPRNFPPLPEAGTAGKMLMLDVLIAETAEPLKQPTAAELLDLARTGKLKSNSRIRLLSLENVPAFTNFAEMAPRVQGRTATGLTVTPIYSDINVGTLVHATTRLEPDGTALIQLNVEKSAIVRNSDPPELREPESISRMLVQSTLRVKLGEPVVLSAGPTNGSDAASQTWVVLQVNVQ